MLCCGLELRRWQWWHGGKLGQDEVHSAYPGDGEVRWLVCTPRPLLIALCDTNTGITATAGTLMGAPARSSQQPA